MGATLILTGKLKKLRPELKFCNHNDHCDGESSKIGKNEENYDGDTYCMTRGKKFLRIII